MKSKIQSRLYLFFRTVRKKYDPKDPKLCSLSPIPFRFPCFFYFYFNFYFFIYLWAVSSCNRRASLTHGNWLKLIVWFKVKFKELWLPATLPYPLRPWNTAERFFLYTMTAPGVVYEENQIGIVIDVHIVLRLQSPSNWKLFPSRSV